MNGYRPEQASGHGHYQGGWNALPAHVSDAEIQMLVFDEIVIQVPTDFFRGDDLGGKVDIFSLRERREGLGNHGHLNLPGDYQILLHSLFVLR